MATKYVLTEDQVLLAATESWFEPLAVYVNVPYLSRIRALFASQTGDLPDLSADDISQVGNYLTIKFQLLENPEAPAPFKADTAQTKLMTQQVDHIYKLWDKFHRNLARESSGIDGMEILKCSEFELFPSFGECIIDVDCNELLKPLHIGSDNEHEKVWSA